MNDVAIPLAFRARPLVLADALCVDLAESNPRAFIRLVIDRYLTCLFSGPAWGFIEEETIAS